GHGRRRFRLCRSGRGGHALAGVGGGQYAVDQPVHRAGRGRRRGNGGGGGGGRGGRRLRLAGGDAHAGRQLQRAAARGGGRSGGGLARGDRVVVVARVLARAQ